MPESPGIKRHLLLVAAVSLAVVVVVAIFALKKAKPKDSAPLAATPQSSEPILEDNQPVLARYAGSASCRECHLDEHTKWAASNHGMAEREYRPDLDDVAFSPPKTIEHGSQTARAELADRLGEFLMKGFEGKDDRYRVVRVIGHDPLRQFLISGPNDHLQTAELCWDPHREEWFNVYGDEDRQPGEWGHWTGRGMTWNSMCASCHNTRLRKNYDQATDRYHMTMAEMGVGCESCHGPSKEHVTWQRQRSGSGSDPHLPRFTRDQTIETCAPCHSRRTELTGDLIPGASFFDHFELTIPDDTDLYYPDGQVREEDYEYASFLGSTMHTAGVRCTDCHDPHSAKRLLPGNALCMKCHAGSAKPIPPLTKVAPPINPTAHSHHRPDSTGNDCTGCHMPVTTYMQRHPRHDHGFTIPDPLLTKKFGIPNACNRCHDDKDADWALAATNEWYGEKMNRPTRTRATIFAEARAGEFRARDKLIAFLRSDDTPPWKASACLLLGRWAFDQPAMAALRHQLDHSHPIVRAAAVRALDPPAQANSPGIRAALQPLLADPSRNVRVAAAWALRDTVDLESTAGRELLHALEISSDQPAGQMRLGQFKFARQEPEEAIAHMRKAIAWDPNSPPFHHDLAIMLNLTGDNRGAIASLEEACRLHAENAEYHYKLALAWHEQGELDRTVELLEKTVEIDPAHGRAWYNLGLAYNTQERPQPALDALLRGEHADPADPGIPYARATIHLRLGQREAAIQAARRALEIDPGFVQARQFLLQLGE